jgi:excisionase family DNA binding protein
MQDDPQSDLIPMEQFATTWKVKTRTVRDWVRRGEAPPSIVVGRKRYFRRSAIPAWLESREQGE